MSVKPQFLPFTPPPGRLSARTASKVHVASRYIEIAALWGFLRQSTQNEDDLNSDFYGAEGAQLGLCTGQCFRWHSPEQYAMLRQRPHNSNFSFAAPHSPQDVFEGELEHVDEEVVVVLVCVVSPRFSSSLQRAHLQSKLYFSFKRRRRSASGSAVFI